MYRTAALAVLRSKVDLIDEKNVVQTVLDAGINVELGSDGSSYMLNGERVDLEIRTGEVSDVTSKISAIPDVRSYMVNLQRRAAEDGNIVVEGRDIGTVVFPDADVKFFITASIEERARRRFDEISGNGSSETLEDIENDIRKRDERDSTREVSPLMRAEDAIILDTTDLTVDEQVEQITNIITERLKSRGTKELQLNVHQR